MPDVLDQYQTKTTDWRATIRRNNRRTFFVIAVFILIYISVGLLIDMYSYVATLPPSYSLTEILTNLITFRFIPYATIISFFIAVIALLVSYSLHDKLMLLGTNYHEITPDNATTSKESQLYNVVEELKIASGLRYMPKVYIIDADYMNAFASGYSEKSAMVAITRGLLDKLDRDELQAVMAHELSHIRHLDIKLTLTASLLANITLMMLDLFFYNAMYASRISENGNNRSKNSLATIIILLRYLLPVINIVLLLYLSRTRELSADAGCVQLMRANKPLASALIKISDDYMQNRDAYSEQIRATPHENVRREAYLYDPFQAGIKDISSISDFFSTHPSLQTRLAALGFASRKDVKKA